MHSSWAQWPHHVQKTLFSRNPPQLLVLAISLPYIFVMFPDHWTRCFFFLKDIPYRTETFTVLYSLHFDQFEQFDQFEPPCLWEGSRSALIYGYRDICFERILITLLQAPNNSSRVYDLSRAGLLVMGPTCGAELKSVLKLLVASTTLMPLLYQRAYLDGPLINMIIVLHRVHRWIRPLMAKPKQTTKQLKSSSCLHITCWYQDI